VPRKPGTPSLQRHKPSGQAVVTLSGKDVYLGVWPELLFMDHLRGTLDQFASGPRVVDQPGEPTDQIEDRRLAHFVDALRYLAAWLKRGGLGNWTPSIARDKGVLESAPPGAFIEPVQRGRREGDWRGRQPGRGLPRLVSRGAAKQDE
jgi:hypothetical protein